MPGTLTPGGEANLAMTDLCGFVGGNRRVDDDVRYVRAAAIDHDPRWGGHQLRVFLLPVGGGEPADGDADIGDGDARDAGGVIERPRVERR